MTQYDYHKTCYAVQQIIKIHLPKANHPILEGHMMPNEDEL